MQVREGGRVINAAALVATGVNGDGHREVLGMRAATSETAPARNEFPADLTARGPAGVRLVTSGAHASLREAIAGEPVNAEPGNHSAVRWFPDNAVPAEFVSTTRQALMSYLHAGPAVTTEGF